MAKETKTVQCYPDDDKINAMSERYAAFGWELIGNQRCREEGAYVVTTFHKLTFTRDKNSPWYGKVSAMESEYDKLMNREPVLYANSPSKGWLFYGIVGLALGALIWVVFGSFAGNAYFELFTLIPALVVIGIGAVLLTIFIVKTKKYNKAYNRYYNAKKEWENTSKKEAEEILAKSEAIVNGN